MIDFMDFPLPHKHEEFHPIVHSLAGNRYPFDRDAIRRKVVYQLYSGMISESLFKYLAGQRLRFWAHRRLQLTLHTYLHRGYSSPPPIHFYFQLSEVMANLLDTAISKSPRDRACKFSSVTSSSSAPQKEFSNLPRLAEQTRALMGKVNSISSYQ